MKGTFVRQYRSAAGNPVFVYSLTGSDSELAQYKTIQGENHRVDDETGKALYFTTRFGGNSANIIITQNERVVLDMSEFDKANSLVSQYGGNLGQALAEATVGNLLGITPASAPAAAAPTAATTPVAEVEDDKQPGEDL